MAQSIDEQLDILMRGVEYGDDQLYEHMRDELRKRLLTANQTGEPLRVYCGYDPTAPDLHLGHTVSMRKLRHFQDLGHQAIFVIGTYTALIGDPSDRDKARPLLSQEQINKNTRTYTEQAFQILDPDRTEIRYNGEWLGRLAFGDLINLASNFTVQQFLAREKFSERYETGDPIWLHEFFYALMQGYDAVVLEADVQLGTTEQLFNIMAGRKLQEAFDLTPQVAITMPILVGTDGHIRMSQSIGNYIGINESPASMYGKVMSLPDEVMENYFNLVTRWPPAKIADLMHKLHTGTIHPMACKKMLAWEITDIFHGQEAADAAAKHFARVHQQRELPQDMPTHTLHEPVKLVDLMAEQELTSSKSQARRLIRQHGVRLDGEVVEDIHTVISPNQTQVLRVGKRRFLKLLSPSH
ncbi:MAG: tyrosine--tRNA ligase [Chloroflexi bacterium]|jgi:tyrosyl-tRNA synthetase|nr:tyrosine--tRNA ligase [Chloroflexota bacterium]